MDIHDLTQDERNIINRVKAAGQEHVLRFWDELDTESRRRLLLQLKDIDFDLIARLYRDFVMQDKSRPAPGNFEPADYHTLPETPSEVEKRNQLCELGESLLRQGRVAAFLVAGGQGSRLGYDGPKGAFPVTPVKRKPLFQLHAEKILALSRKYDSMVPWYIMTSESNHAATEKFFEENDYFGFPSESVSLFRQGMIPAMDPQGKLFLGAKGKVFTNPNGHGGSLSALKKSGALEDMKQNGIELIFYFQVDNVLARICDPAFIGLHVSNEAEMSAKVVKKIDPEEKIGIIGKVDGRYSVIEYSDFSDEEKHARNPDGSLVFSAGSIAIHLFNVDFVERKNEHGLQLPWHVAHKRVSHLDETGRLVEPEKPNGYKFETFVFDALKDAERVVVMEVEREQEFSPVKNAEGPDSPTTAHRDMCNLFGSWLRSAGAEVPRDSENNVLADIEISPLFALSEDELGQKIDPGIKVSDRLYLG